jgi:hypothetical protein
MSTRGKLERRHERPAYAADARIHRPLPSRAVANPAKRITIYSCDPGTGLIPLGLALAAVGIDRTASPGATDAERSSVATMRPTASGRKRNVMSDDPKKLQKMTRAEFVRFLALDGTMGYGSTESGCVILSQWMKTSAGKEGIKVLAVRMEDPYALDDMIMRNEVDFLSASHDDTIGYFFGVEAK